MLGKTGHKKARRASKSFEPEIIYRYWSEAGGVVQQAMRLAAEAGEKRVPKKAHVWAAYAEKHSFAERLRAEEKKRWDEYHKQREERQQQVLDQVAETFEEFAKAFSFDVMLDVTAMESDDPEVRKGAIWAFRKRFGNMKAVNQFFRMYLRARGEPETISSTKVEHSGSISTYNDLESRPKPRSIDEARAIADSLVDGKSD